MLGSLSDNRLIFQEDWCYEKTLRHSVLLYGGVLRYILRFKKGRPGGKDKYGGIIGETIVNLTKQFNTAHENITVEPQFQGSYDEAINKLKTAMRTKSGPDLIQIYEGGTRFMVDSGFISGVLLGLLAQNRTKKGSLFRILCALPMAVSSACASIISEPV